MINIQIISRLLTVMVATASISSAQVVINEIQSSNDQTCFDQDGDNSDWIELYNAGASAADLHGWGLSDNAGKPFKWAFPTNCTMVSGSFLRIFASGKDRTNSVITTSSGAAPDSLSGLVLWLRADDAAPFGSGGSVTNWADASGMGNNAYQATASKAPTYLPNAINGHAALQFTKTSLQVMYLPTATFNGMTSFTNATLIVVCKWGGTATSGLIGISGYDKANSHWEIQTGGTVRWRCADANIQFSGAATADTWMSLMVADDSMRETPTTTLLRDGTVRGSQEVSFGSLQGFNINSSEQLIIGSSHAALISERAFDGQIAEVIWYNRALTAAERTELSLFLAKKYAMPFQGGSVSSELHTNFSLGSEGETLLLTKRDGEVADIVTFGDIPCDTSYGRSPDGANALVWFAEPTPGTTNAPATYTAPLSQPSFSRERGIYDAPMSLTLSHPDAEAQIRYTLDLTEPSETNGLLYTAAISITNTTVVRAKAIKAGTLPCRNIATHSYIYLADVAKNNSVPDGCPNYWTDSSGTCPAKYGVSTNVVKTAANEASLEAALRAVPVLCINAPWPDLFDADTGLYTHPNADGLEALISAEWLTNGTGRVQIDAGLRIQGAASRMFARSPKKSLRLAFRGRYGSSKLRSKVLEEGGCDIDEFDSLALRAEYNNSWIHSDSSQRTRGSFVRDQWARDTQNLMSGYGSRGAHVQLFINGRYWGLYNIAQRIDDSFAAFSFGGDKEDYDVIALGVARDGDLAAWSATVSLMAKDLSNNTNYESAAAYVDLGRLADYMLINFYGANNDWPGNNWSCVRKRETGAKWSFCCWDVERTLEGVNESRLAAYTTATYGPAYFHTRFASNTEYRLTFADRVHKHLFNGGALTPTPAITRYSNLCVRVEGAIYGETARWGAFAKEANGYGSWSGVTKYYGVLDWTTERDRILRTYLPQRTAIFLSQLKAYGLYPAVDAPEFASTATENGQTVSLSIPAGATVYFTTDGSDPRTVYTGAVSANALTYSEPLSLIASATLRARAVSNGVWSAISEFAVKLDKDKPTFIQTSEGNWDKNENWSTGVYPNAAGAWAIIHAPEGLDEDGKRNVRINKSAITIGHIELENGSATNRICNKKDATAGSNLTFNGNEGEATVAVLDQGVGMTLVDVNYGIVLATDLRLVVSNYTGNADYGALRLQGNWSGAGGLIKDGPGFASVTGDGKAYTGASRIKEGVLAFTAKAIPTATSSFTVEAGGQLRLISDSISTNAFPCPVSLAGFGRDEALADLVKGSSGALRFDPLAKDSTAILPAPVTINGGTGIHVDGQSNTLLLTGGISGFGGLRKTGGGTLGLALAAPTNIGAISGTGTLANVFGTLVAPSLTGVKLASRLYAAGLGALASNGLAQVSGTCEPESLSFYIDTPAQGTFCGGLFVPLSEPLAARLASLPVSVYIKDSAGTNSFAGISWTATNAVISATPVCWNALTGRVIAVTFGATATPHGYGIWRTSTFGGDADDTVAGPSAETGNVPNLFRYAFGMTLADAAAVFYPNLSVSGEASEYRVRLDPSRDDLRYLIEATDSLSDWSHAELLFDSDIDIPETLDASGWLVLPDSKRSPTRFYRLKVLLKDFE